MADTIPYEAQFLDFESVVICIFEIIYVVHVTIYHHKEANKVILNNKITTNIIHCINVGTKPPVTLQIILIKETIHRNSKIIASVLF